MIGRRTFLEGAFAALVGACAMPLVGCVGQGQAESTERHAGNVAGSSSASVSSEQGESDGASQMEKSAGQESAGNRATEGSGQSAEQSETNGTFQLEVGGATFKGMLGATETAEAFARRLPMTLAMDELSGNEKYNFTGQNSPGDDELPAELHAGEIWVYLGDCVVLFYQDHANPGYGYKYVGALDDAAGLADAVGTGSVTVTFR